MVAGELLDKRLVLILAGAHFYATGTFSFFSFFFSVHKYSIILAVRGLEEHVRVSLIIAIIISFMLFTVFTLVYVLYFEEILIHNSHGFMILKNY